ncbi:MAG TPA: hypothetical protein VGQ44_17375 [Gemmatimonadaceae bacterium]|jgi:hypothetical protein|nr:hypothetical protein [Gemmatimonadaceae bacterium]
MGRQLFTEGPYIDPPVASNPGVTGAAGSALVSTSAEALWIGAQFTPIYANDPKAGKIYTVRAGGILSTGASGTLILIPQYGALGGTTLGTSITQTVPINLTNVPWYLEFTLVFRTIGSGVNSTCIGTGYFQAAGTAATAGSSFDLAFGGTSATVDVTVNSGITISKTLSVAGSFTTQYAFIHGYN